MYREEKVNKAQNSSKKNSKNASPVQDDHYFYQSSSRL